MDWQGTVKGQGAFEPSHQLSLGTGWHNDIWVDYKPSAAPSTQ